MIIGIRNIAHAKTANKEIPASTATMKRNKPKVDMAVHTTYKSFVRYFGITSGFYVIDEAHFDSGAQSV